MLGQQTFYPKFPILSFKHQHLDLMIWITNHLEFSLTVMTAFQMSIKAITMPLAITEIVLEVCLIILNQPKDLKQFFSHTIASHPFQFALVIQISIEFTLVEVIAIATIVDLDSMVEITNQVAVRKSATIKSTALVFTVNRQLQATKLVIRKSITAVVAFVTTHTATMESMAATGQLAALPSLLLGKTIDLVLEWFEDSIDSFSSEMEHIDE